MATIELDPQCAAELRRICEQVRDDELKLLHSLGRDYTVPGASPRLHLAWRILSQLEEQGYAND